MRYHRLIRVAVALAVVAAGFFAIFQTWKILRSRAISAPVSLPASSASHQGQIVKTETLAVDYADPDEGNEYPNPTMLVKLQPPPEIEKAVQKSMDSSPFQPFRDCKIEGLIKTKSSGRASILWTSEGMTRFYSDSGLAILPTHKRGFEIKLGSSGAIMDGNLLHNVCNISVTDFASDKTYLIEAACDVELMKRTAGPRPVAVVVTWRAPVVQQTGKQAAAEPNAHETKGRP